MTGRRGEGRARATAPAALALAAVVFVAGALFTGCASGPVDSARSFARVTPLPPVIAHEGQTPRDQAWDVRDCQAEAGSRTNYSPTDSPLGNLFQKLFFWGTAGAALGGTIDGFPVLVASTRSSAALSEASTGLIVGASTGGAVGAATSWQAQSRYERAWAQCIESRGYSIGSPTTGSAASDRP